MRVIAGTFRGRRLIAPEGLDTRPISDRVKGALFDVLGSRLSSPGTLPDVHVLDLFCGPGSHGIEAMSRGAACCTFVDASEAALKCLRQNLAAFGIESRSRVIRSRVERLSAGPPQGNAFDLVFFDPPYAMSENLRPESRVLRACARFGNRIPIAPDAIMTWRHHDRCVLPDELPGGWRRFDRRTWGEMAISFFEQMDAEPE